MKDIRKDDFNKLNSLMDNLKNLDSENEIYNEVLKKSEKLKKLPPPPLPPPIKNKLISPIQELTNHLDKPIKQTGFNPANRFMSYYFFPVLLMVFNFIGLGLIITQKEIIGLFYIMFLSLYIGIIFPILLGLSAFMIFRILYYDKNYLTGEISKRIAKDFIIANFFLTQKRVSKRVCKIEPDGISFIIGDSVYIIDREECWIDEDNYINGYWLPNLPNQLKFDFGNQIKKALQKLKQIKDGEQDIDLGDTDILYTSQNLKKYKDDKFLAEMHEQFTPEAMKMLYIAFGVIALCVIGFIIMFMTRK